MDRITQTFDLLKAELSDECNSLGENMVRLIIDDYYYSRDIVKDLMLREFGYDEIENLIDGSIVEALSARVSVEEGVLSEYISIKNQSTENIHIIDDIVNIESIIRMYASKKLGYGFVGVESILPSISDALSGVASIVTIIQFIQMNKRASNNSDKDKLELSSKIDALLELLKANKMTKDERSQVLFQLRQLTKQYVRQLKRITK